MLYSSLDKNLHIILTEIAVRRVYSGLLSVNLYVDFLDNRTNYNSYRMVKIITPVLLFIPLKPLE